MIVTPIDESNIQIKIDANLYSSEVIHKCFYWYGGKFLVDIKTEQGFFLITISDPDNDWNPESIINKIKIDLIDFKTREIISCETKNIRDILAAKAFAHGDEFDELPPGNVNDPIGF